MNNYIKWNEKQLSEFSELEVERSYEQGYVFTRKFKGSMEQTRSLRIKLANFELSSENRRVLNKNQNLQIEKFSLPLGEYDFQIHKMGKDFYESKFGEKTMSASKIKEMLTDQDKSNFNSLFSYSINNSKVGYCICVETQNILHYSYPFYTLDFDKTTLGMAMMLKAILWAQESQKTYVYIGSFKDISSKYKLQFKGLEWFDGNNWKMDIEELKKTIEY